MVAQGLLEAATGLATARALKALCTKSVVPSTLKFPSRFRLGRRIGSQWRRAAGCRLMAVLTMVANGCTIQRHGRAEAVPKAVALQRDPATPSVSGCVGP